MAGTAVEEAEKSEDATEDQDMRPPEETPARRGQQGPLRKRWVWTLNNYVEPDDIKKIEQLAAECTYLVYGFEVAPTTGTPHLQGYLELKQEKRVAFLRIYLPHAWIGFKAVRGSAEENRKYCLKIRERDKRKGTPPNDRYIEYGICPKLGEGQGKRTDLDAAARLIKAQGLAALIEQHPGMYIHYANNFEKYAAKVEKARDFKTHVTVIIGPPRTGKSALAYRYPRPFAVPKPTGDNVWFDGFDNSIHDTMLLEDFRGNIKLDLLLTLCDRYQMQLPVKGKFTQMQAKHLVITSNRKPSEWYKKLFAEYPDQRLALEARIDTVIYVPALNRYEFLRGALPEGVTLPQLEANEAHGLIQWPDEISDDPMAQRFAAEDAARARLDRFKGMVCREHPNTTLLGQPCACQAPVMCPPDVAKIYQEQKAREQRRIAQGNARLHRAPLVDRQAPSAPGRIVGPPLPADWAERNRQVPGFGQPH